MAFASAKDVFEKMPQAFNADAAKGADTVFQFHIAGDEQIDRFVTVKDGTVKVDEGTAADSTVAITMAEKDFLDMISGKLNGAMAFMSGKLKAKGDIMAAQKLTTFFKLG